MKIYVQMTGDNPTRLWGLSPEERTTRIVARNGTITEQSTADAVLVVNRAFAFHPRWVELILARPGTVLTSGGIPVIAHVPGGTPVPADGMPQGLSEMRAEDHADHYDVALRKREQLFLLQLTPDTVRAAERASYAGAYKGVTDALTKYVWPEIAFHLTRLAAALGMSPNMVTAIGAAGCVAATFFFWYGWYLTGIAVGFVFMVLDTVDGKLARCTMTSSWWGNVFDHGIDLVHPPFWWAAWAVGLAAWGIAMPPATQAIAVGAIVVGYVVQRLIEGVFIKRYDLEIHVWERIDSRFRLITARRNPNIVILLVSVLLGRPDIGLIAVAWWTVLCCLFHAVRLIQAEPRFRRDKALRSWLEGA